jgi:hypothetical protein
VIVTAMAFSMMFKVTLVAMVPVSELPRVVISRQPPPGSSSRHRKEPDIIPLRVEIAILKKDAVVIKLHD